jgi:hypothetical protein
MTTQIRLSAAAHEFVRERGGRLFVFAREGALAVATEPPEEGTYVRQPAKGIALHLPRGFVPPRRVRVELRELPEPHLVAWNDDLQA